MNSDSSILSENVKTFPYDTKFTESAKDNYAFVAESISHVIGESLKSFSSKPEDLIRLGMGIGASLGAQGIFSTSHTQHKQNGHRTQKSAINCELTSKDSASLNKSDNASKEQSFNVTERIGYNICTSRDNKSDELHYEDIAAEGQVKEGRNLANFLDSTTIPQGLLDIIAGTRVGKRHVEYLPFTFNLPYPRNIETKRPRSLAEEWAERGYDPWSEGKEPTSTQFIRSLSHETKKWPKRHDSVKEQVVSNNAHDFDALCSFVRHGKYREIEDMINNPDWTLPIDFCDDAGNTLLMIACQNGNKRIAKLCLRRGSQINKQNLNGNSCLHFAFGYGFGTFERYLMY